MPADDRTTRGTPAVDKTEKQAAAHQAVDILHEISTILVWAFTFPPSLLFPPWVFIAFSYVDKNPGGQNCHLDRRTVSICISLIENGINPEALASVVQELRAEAQEVQAESAERRR
ncbi:mitotic-spindle organizing gamma-tubulin ring associated-domain-containing protein [Coniochaeta sp. 2T2.1]|nr:mitotic-spindle organizing gamma-tubulin ring associated-domain-containing protein [Coniochaeta sp. 2T2.1]